MDMCGGLTTPDYFRIDDLLDFSNDQLFSSSTPTTTDHHQLLSSPNTSTAATASATHFHASTPTYSPTDFTHHLSIPNDDDVAQLEWLSTFIDDTFTDFPTNPFTGTLTHQPNTSPHHQSPPNPTSSNPKKKTKNFTTKKRENVNITGDRIPTTEVVARRCTHCASEKTPQWRTGPIGPKTLCNACGVRYKSGRLVPEYRPAASPTFVLTQHSNSHRKVLELRRQKEVFYQ